MTINLCFIFVENISTVFTKITLYLPLGKKNIYIGKELSLFPPKENYRLAKCESLNFMNFPLSKVKRKKKKEKRKCFYRRASSNIIFFPS